MGQCHGLIVSRVGFDAGALAVDHAVVPTGGVQRGGGYAAQAVFLLGLSGTGCRWPQEPQLAI